MKRTISKKSVSLHKEPNLKEELRNLDNIQLTSENILERLLHPANQEKKTVLNDARKYHPNFQKPDYQTLADENQALKLQLKNEKQISASLKFKLGEVERKLKFLEAIQEKWESGVEAGEEGRKQAVYTQILKKKIQQLSEVCLSSEEKIRQLKQLPHVSVFEENCIEKEYLMRETIRLKAVITSMGAAPEEATLEGKLLRLMKEENEKLKSTIRLFQNDKSLLKSRQIIQRRQIADSRKEIETLKTKLTARQADIERLNNENKNLLFKKVNQLKVEEQRKENEEITKLKQSMDDMKEENRRLENEKETLGNEYQKLKKNEKINETKQNNQDKEKNDLRLENTRLRRTIEELREQLAKEQDNFRQLENENRKKRREKVKPIAPQRLEQYPTVKFEDIELPLMMLIHRIEDGSIPDLAALFDEEQLRCGRLIDIFSEEPLGLDRSEAMKLARYIVEDNQAKKVVYNDKASAPRKQCLEVLKATMRKMQECRNESSESAWRCILARSKKLLPQMEKMKGELITKQNFLALLGRHINEPFGDYVTLLLLESLEPDSSESETTLKMDKLVQTLTNILSHQSLR